MAAEKAAIEQAFGAVEYVQAEGVTGECAFITAEMDGAAYDKAAGAEQILEIVAAAKAAQHGNFGDGVICHQQHLGGLAQPDVIHMLFAMHPDGALRPRFLRIQKCRE